MMASPPSPGSSPSLADLSRGSDQLLPGNDLTQPLEDAKTGPQPSVAESTLTKPAHDLPVEPSVEPKSEPVQASKTARKGSATKEVASQDTQVAPPVSRSAQVPPAAATPAANPPSSSTSKAKIAAKAILSRTRPKSTAAPASTLPKLDVPPAAAAATDRKTSEDATQKQTKPSKQAKKEKADAAAKAIVKQPPAPTLREITKLPELETPSAIIIAVHDPDSVLDTAWAYVPDKPPPKRQNNPPVSRPSQADGGKSAPKSTVDTSNQRPPSYITTLAPQTLQAGLEFLNNDYKNREEREKSDRYRVENWASVLPDSPTSPTSSKFPEKTQSQGVPHSVVAKNDDMKNEKDSTNLTADNSIAGGGEESGRRPSMRRGSQFPILDTKPILEEDFNSHPSSRPSSKSGSKPRSEKEKTAKSVKQANWLTHQTMLASELDQARVLVFEYASFRPPPPRPTSSPEVECEKYLESTAEALLQNLKKKRLVGGGEPLIPLVFIANNLGCIVIQKLVTLVGRSEQDVGLLGNVASILLLDSPRSVKETEKTERTEKTKATSKAVKAATAATNKTGQGPPTSSETKLIDTNALWKPFQEGIKKSNISTVWFYTQASDRLLPPNDPDIDLAFVKWEQVAAVSSKDPKQRTLSRFRGPQDRNYLQLVSQLKRCLLFWAAADKERLTYLIRMIDRRDDLGLTDQNQRSCLHRAAERVNDAAVHRLINARLDLASIRDIHDSTPLHTIVKTAVSTGLDEDDKIPVQGIIDKLRDALHQNQQNDDDLKDTSGNIPGDYAPGDAYEWIRKRCAYRALLKGTRAAQPETIRDPRPPLSEPAKEASKRIKATLAQFYIYRDNTSDYLDPQRPHVHTVLYDERYGIEELFQRNLRHDDDYRPTCRWIHLPANNEKWIHDLFSYQLRRIDKSTRDRRHLGQAPFDRHIAPDAFRYKQVYDPVDEQGNSRQGHAKKTVTALFMPVFGFEKHKNRKKLSKQMKNISYPGIDETSLLIKAYLNDQPPLHCRRTLDQFTYHMLEDTERRDMSQVMFRWAGRERKRRDKAGSHSKGQLLTNERPATEDYPILMIDQLWLWILEDEQTVITSLPNTWDQTEEYNLERYLRQRVLSENNERQLINNPLDLANSIIRGSIDFLSRRGPLGITMYECFQSSITLVAERQAQKFDDFKVLVGKLNARDLDQQTRAKLTNELFQLTTETKLLAEIMDIQDELKSSHEVMNKQREALEKFLRLLPSEQGQGQDRPGDDLGTPESSIHGFSSDENLQSLATSPGLLARSETLLPSALRGRGSARKGKGTVQFSDQGFFSETKPDTRSKPSQEAKENLLLVERNIATIKEMTTYAKKIQVEASTLSVAIVRRFYTNAVQINGLLSHRQKQANIWEARFAREGSEHTQRQSNITLVFTMVTVFFLPLSFMASVFAIQIDAFPHNETTGEVSWPLRQILGLLFGISFSLILFVAFLGLYINQLSQFLTRYLNPKVPQPRRTDNPGGGDSDTDFDDIESRRGGSAASDEPDADTDVGQDQSTDMTAPAPSAYAPLFGRWSFHVKVPWVRRLWEYDDNRKISRKHHDPDSDANSDVSNDANSDDTRATVWTRDSRGFYVPGRDYPLRRFMRVVAELVPRKAHKDPMTGAVGDDDYIFRPSITPPRDEGMTEAEDWDLTPGQIRTRKSTQPLDPTRSISNHNMLFSLPQWQNTPDAPEEQEWPVPTSRGAKDDNDGSVLIGGMTLGDPDEKSSRRRKGMLPAIAGLLNPRKTRETEKEDLEGRPADQP